MANDIMIKKENKEYLFFLERVFRECYRVASERCVFFLNIGDSAGSQGKSEEVVKRAERAGFKRLQTIIWVKSIFGKGHYTPSGRDRRLNNLWEFIFVLVKSRNYELDPKNIGIPYSDKSNIGRYADLDKRDAGDIWFIPYVKTTGKNVKKGHEAPFPIELPYQCLKLVKDPKTVLDPFAGTGSTLRAAEERGIKGFGYEILPRENVIQERMKERIIAPKIPLLPQLETYTSFLTEFTKRLVQKSSKKDIEEVLEEFNITPRRSFVWSADDLNMDPGFLEEIKQNKKIFPKGMYLKDDEL
jgi:DNA modification methylase